MNAGHRKTAVESFLFPFRDLPDAQELSGAPRTKKLNSTPWIFVASLSRSMQYGQNKGFRAKSRMILPEEGVPIPVEIREAAQHHYATITSSPFVRLCCNAVRNAGNAR